MHIDGPAFYGDPGGALGSTLGGAAIVLIWRSTGRVGINKTGPATALEVVGTELAKAFNSAGGPVQLVTTDNQPLELNRFPARTFDRLSDAAPPGQRVEEHLVGCRWHLQDAPITR